MSDYESHSGKLKIVEPKENESFEQLCKRLWIENGEDVEDYDEDNESLFDEYYDKYIKVNGKVWEIIEHKEHGGDDDMFCRLHENSDGTLSFHTRYYNGGTCMSEMITDALEERE